jgi:type I restriction enzyme, S subunit
MMKFYTVGEIIIENPKSTLKVNQSRSHGKYVFYTSGAKTKFHDNFLCDGMNIFLATGGKAIISFFDGKASYSTDCYAITTKPFVNPKFLFYFLQSKIKEINEDMFKGAALKHLQKKQLKDIKIKVPSLSEQLNIVAKLDATFTEIDKNINLTKERIIKEKDLNLSALKSTFSTIKSKKTIGEIATVIAGQSPEGKYYNRDAKGVPFYQGKKEFGDYELKKPTFWTTKTTKEALKGDVLLSVRAPVGETNINNDKICIGRGLAAIRANKDNNSEFIYYFLNSIKKLIVGNTGAVFNSINKKQIEDIVIPIQSLDEQNKTINKIKLISSHIKKINLFTKQKLHNLNILKSSILNCELKK